MERFIEMIEKIVLALIEKMNIVFVLLLLMLAGIMNQEEVFTWLHEIGKAFKGLLP